MNRRQILDIVLFLAIWKLKSSIFWIGTMLLAHRLGPHAALSQSCDEVPGGKGFIYRNEGFIHLVLKVKQLKV